MLWHFSQIKSFYIGTFPALDVDFLGLFWKGNLKLTDVSAPNDKVLLCDLNREMSIGADLWEVEFEFNDFGSIRVDANELSFG